MLIRKGGFQLKRLIWDENGSVLTEYGLLVVIIAVGLIITLGLFKNTLITKFSEIISQVAGAK